jgi:hypothetical protein
MIPLGRATQGIAPGILYPTSDEERDDHLAHASIDGGMSG